MLLSELTGMLTEFITTICCLPVPHVENTPDYDEMMKTVDPIHDEIIQVPEKTPQKEIVIEINDDYTPTSGFQLI